MGSMETSWNDLPQELVDEILVRLPAKSLMRFKCVNWYFNALFTSPTFITKHDQIQIMHKDERFIIFGNRQSRHRGKRILKCSIINLIPDHESTQSHDDVLGSLELYNFQPYGSHNGVFGLHCWHRNRLILWNPVTGEEKLAPPLPPHRQGFVMAMAGGLGSDPNTNDLKIIQLISIHSWYNPPLAELYTLSTNTWTSINKYPVPVSQAKHICDSIGILANGVFHWLSAITNQERCILCFDFRNNQFHTLDLPPIPPPILSCYLRYKNFLHEIDDSIGFVEYHYESTTPWTDIWILEQSPRSWTKKYKFSGSVPIYTFRKDGVEFLGPCTREYSSSEEGSLLPLMLYSFDGQPVLHFEVTIRQDKFTIYSTFKYVESIAPIVPGPLAPLV